MLNISKKIQAGIGSGISMASPKELPIAAITPVGETNAEIKKAERLKVTAAINKELDNIPMPGFTLYRSERKNHSYMEQSWLIIDPRGFLVRIGSKNIEEILQVSGITEGLIQEECVWARDNTDTKMTLIPVSSPKYIEAVKNTTLMDEKVDKSEVQIGDTVITQSGVKGVYMGTLSLYSPMRELNDRDLRPQVHLRRQILLVEPHRYFYNLDIKMLKVIAPTSNPMTREQAAQVINDDIATGKTYFSTSPDVRGRYYGSHGAIKHVSVHAVPKAIVNYKEIPLEEARLLYAKAVSDYDVGLLALEDKKGKLFIPNLNTSGYGRTNMDHRAMEVLQLTNSVVPSEKLTLVLPKPSIWQTDSLKSTKIIEALDNFAKFYKIVKHVKHETYL